MSEEKKRKNLGTYAVIMILAAMILIIIAAMADNREDQFKTRINEQEQINVGIQNQIVRLEDENYKLKKEAEELNAKSATQEQALTFYRTLSEVYGLALEGRPTAATEKLKEIDPASLTEDQKTAYNTLQKQFQLSVE